MIIEDRYNRQELIKGWDQSKLHKTRAVVIGAGTLANFTLASLACLGVGNIEIYDNSLTQSGDSLRGEFLLSESGIGSPKSLELEKRLKQINPSLRVKGVNLKLSGPLLAIVGNPDFIIDTTNNPLSKKDFILYAKSKQIKFISASADFGRVEFYFSNGKYFKDSLLTDYSSKLQSVSLCSLIGGMISEELRKSVMPLDNNDIPVNHIAYTLLSEERFSNKKEYEIVKPDLKNKKALIVGCGALGNFCSLLSSLEGIGSIDLMDPDVVESTNLNRQILFYRSVGKPKAIALEEEIKMITPSVNTRAIKDKLDENSKYFDENTPDIIFDCVDNMASRAIINYYSVRNKIPLVSAGTGPRSGQVIVYIPGKTECLECKLGVEKSLSEQRKSNSCLHTSDPSVIMTNQITASMQVLEGIKVLSDSYGDPLKSVLKYDSQIPIRGGYVGTDGICACEKPDIQSWLKEVDSKSQSA
ncbi:SAMP-activating enzyme E1 [uncultured archaeon]|nr:SAMP-activating enzyme E1 [uncultured archaeon]